jgi:hypothetical protein
MNQNEGLVSFFIWPLTYILKNYFQTKNWKHVKHKDTHQTNKTYDTNT